MKYWYWLVSGDGKKRNGCILYTEFHRRRLRLEVCIILVLRLDATAVVYAWKYVLY